MDRPTLQTPSMFPEEQFARVMAIAEGYMNDVEDGNYIDEDTTHYLFEEVLKALYGDDVFKWINERT